MKLRQSGQGARLGAAGSTVMALLIGAAGGALFAFIGTPLPWTLGAITTSAIAAIAGNRWPMPAGMRTFARPVVGVLAGSAFTPAIVGSMLGWWPSLVVVAVYSLVMSAAGYFLFTRVLRFDSATAYFASTPGGLGELTLLGGALGGRVHTLVLIHAVRVVTVVFGVPLVVQLVHGNIGSATFPGSAHVGLEAWDWLMLIGAGLAGYAIGRFTGFPGGVMIAAMLVSAALHATGVTTAAPPGWLMAVVQVLIGSVAGGRFAGITWADARVDLLAAFGWAAAMLGSAVLVTALAVPMLGVPFETLLLALAPGGAAEMIVISYALQAEAAFVAFCHVSRIFLVLALAPAFFGLIPPRGPKPD